MKVVYLHPERSQVVASGGDPRPQHWPPPAPSEIDALSEARRLLATVLAIADSEQPPRRNSWQPSFPAPPARKRQAAPSPAAILAATVSRTPRTATPVQILSQVLHRNGRSATADPPMRSPERSGGGAPAGDAFWRMWNEHRDALLRRCLRLSGGNRADAEDALGEAMLKAAQAFRQGDIRSERAWLLRLAHNACMDQYRSNRRQSRLADELGGEAGENAQAAFPTNDRSPEEHLDAAHLFRDLRRAVAALPESLSLPLLLHLEERPDDEIAQALNVTKEVVRKRRQMARDRLRRFLQER